MSEPLLNINFCGSRMDPFRKDLASIRAITRFKHNMLIPGVGAPRAYNANKHEHHLTPGTFYIDQHGQLQNRILRAPDLYYTGMFGAGLLFGSGESDIIDLAMNRIDDLIRDKNVNQSFHINMSGYSRGGMSALHLANNIYLKYGNRIKINLFLIDPIGGVTWTEQSRRNIPPNVENAYISMNQDEIIPQVQSHHPSHFVLTNPNTNIAILYVKGCHTDQEIISKQNALNWNAPANVMKHLLTLFYQSYGAIPLNPNDEAQPPLNLQQTDVIKTGFIKNNKTKNALNNAIRSLQTTSANQAASLACVEMQSIEDENYLQFNYYCMHLLAELTREKQKHPDQTTKLDLLMDVTKALIFAMTPKNGCSIEEKVAALTTFQQCTQLNTFSTFINTLASYLIGLSVGILLIIPYSLIGLSAGLLSWSTLGLATIPAVLTGIKDALTQGIQLTQQTILGEQNEMHLLNEARSLLHDEEKTHPTSPNRP